MRRALLCLLMLVPALYLLGCGPVGIALAGGTTGGIFGFGGKKEKEDNNAAPFVIVNALLREDSPASINYLLLDPESNAASISAQYRVGAGPWQNCTAGLGGDGTSGLASSPAGVPHVFKWDFVSDLGTTALTSPVDVRVAANDGRQGPFGERLGLVIGNDPPVVSGVNANATSGLVLVSFTISDSSSDVGTVDVAFSTDQAQTWNVLSALAGDFLGSPPAGLLTTTGGQTAQFIWNSNVSLPSFQGDVFLRLVPKDAPPGYPLPTEGAAVVFGPVQISNTANTPPRLTVLTPLTGAVESSRVRVEYTLADDQSNPSEVFVEWSLNGTAYNTATVSNQTLPGVSGPFVTTPAPARFELVWEALVDFAAAAPNSVFLRLTPRDAAAGQAQVFGPLTVFGNRAPEVGSVSVQGNGGNVQLTLNLRDSSSDRVSVALEMIVGGVPTALTSTDFGGADLTNLRASPGGEDNLLLWNTSLALAGVNDSAVRLRVTPTDLPATFGAAALSGAPYVSESFPVINNPSGPSPMQVVVTSSTATVPFGGGVVVNAQVLPATASQSVSWSIVEGAGYGTLMFFPPQVYFAPGVPPTAYRPYVTVRATSTVNSAVFGDYRFYWGNPPTSVSVGPSGQSVLLGDSLRMTAQAAPLGLAPQIVSWKVVEGPASGSIDADGLYRAPAAMPPSPVVTIRATAVNGVVGNTTLTLAQRPNRVVVSAAGQATTLALDGTLQFSAQVNPFPDTPQAVRWRILFDGEDRGAGDAAVGRIDASGLYAAPHFLPRPVKVQIEASSNVLPAISGRYTLTLAAPLPTSLDVTPATATVIAGGKGRQFSIFNLLPDNAGAAVVWTRSPALGTIDTEGRYTPPAGVAQQTVVVITATSAVAPGVNATATLTVMPATADIPVSLTIVANTPAVPSGGSPVQFYATVSPDGSPQAVSWSVISGGGSIQAATGLYTPPVTSLDATVTLRATSDANGSVFDEYTLCITGAGSPWALVSGRALGRDQPSGFHDALNNYFWVIGGKSEASGTRHDTGVFAYDLTTNRWLSLPPVGDGAMHNTISAALDSVNQRILAVVGDEYAPAQLFALDLNNLAGGWLALSPGGIANAPVLPGNFRYLTFFDPGAAAPGDERLFVVKDGVSAHTVYRLNTSTDVWLTPLNLAVTAAPREPSRCVHAYSASDNRHFVIGEPGAVSPSSGLFVWQVNPGAFTFTPQAQSGAIPAGFLNGAQAAFDAARNRVLVHGGSQETAGFSSGFWSLNLTTPGQAVWSNVTISGESAPSRAFGAMAATGNRALLFGGRDEAGAFGDLWDFDLSNLGLAQVTRTGLSPLDFAPQGRRWAAGVWVASVNRAFHFGGQTASGASNELWEMSYDALAGSVGWLRVTPAGQAPPRLFGASLVLDAARNRLLLFGGSDGSTLFSDVYAFDLATRQWSLLAPLGTPPAARWAAAACFRESADQLIVYGGKQDTDVADFGSNLAADVHLLDFSGGPQGVWVQPAVVAPTVPDGRMGATAGFDTLTQKLLVHGGYSRPSQGNGQLLALDLGSGIWSVPGISNAAHPAGAFDCATAFMPDCARFVSAPGLTGATQALVMGLPKARWQNLTAAPSAHARGASGLFDPVNKRFFVVFGNQLQYGVEAGSSGVRVMAFK